MGHHRKKRKTRKSPLPASTRSRQVCFSIALFAASSIVFIHQCIRPFIAFTPAHLSRNFGFVPHPTLHSKSSTRDTSYVSKPQNWFAVAGDATRGSLGADGDSALPERGKLPVASNPNPSGVAQALERIPEGPIPLPSLRNATGGNETDDLPMSEAPAPGSSWTGSLARGVLSALPLHWVAEAIHAAPKKEDEKAASELETDSIFQARRKGAWMGCSQPFHLVCKGIYRAIKVTNAVHIIDVSCQRNVEWLPHIVHKLRTEFRLVHLTCVVGVNDSVSKVKEAYASVEKLRVAKLDPFHDPFPNGTDLIVAYRFLEDGTLIDAMRFFKNVKASESVKMLATETYPSGRNILKRQASGDMKLHINVALAPFWFPPPVYEYENVEENPESERMQISLARVEELFEQKSTPDMKDLVDPRKRHIQE